jgi:hypothetical protein
MEYSEKDKIMNNKDEIKYNNLTKDKDSRIKIYEDTKIFIACPANYATGGPESLHQLCYYLRNDLKVDAIMYYYNYRLEKFMSPVHPHFNSYNLPYILLISKEDDSKNILIVPEERLALSLLSNFKKIRKGIWFLSVDYYYISYLTKKDYFFQRAIDKISKIIIKKTISNFDKTSRKVLDKLIQKYDYTEDQLLKLADFYICNTYRGIQWFNKLNPMFYLKGPINNLFIQEDVDLEKKQNIVAYNPKKGFYFTKKIIKEGKDIKFVPLENMSREEVIETLKKVKVYIDFGNHASVERIPREAVILGCCVITSKRGSVAFFEDVPISDEYKFEDKEENIPKIINKIKDCFENYEERYKDFDYYREVIKNEPQKFLEDLKKIFVKVEK